MAEYPSKSFVVTVENGFCEGHFPGHPIAPAAVQVGWLVDLAQAAHPEATGWSIRQIKLMRELNPGAEIQLSLEATKRGLRGRVADADGPYSDLFLTAHE